MSDITTAIEPEVLAMRLRSEIEHAADSVKELNKQRTATLYGDRTDEQPEVTA